MDRGVIIGTAGHIDHGKSALVTALTGRAMDRLVEEKRRGITIDLNFAPLTFEGLPPAGIVDVPGHEDFVRTMVAGASGIDLVLLVVDAAQGPQPQTWEHLAIVEQLGVRRGIPIITKADLAEREWVDLVADELVERLRTSPVAFEPPHIVSAVSGQGISDFKARLREHLERAGREPEPVVDDGFRMPVDRAFSIAGVGTVVTGTPWSGTLRVGDSVTLLPLGRGGRVRSLEAYGSPVSQARPGQRTAVGIAGLERGAIRRGEMLVDGRQAWRTTTALDGELYLLPGTAPLRRQARVRVHLGTAEVLARVYPRGELPPGGRGLARLALESPLLARGSDRFVLRSYSPVGTIGGGQVLDPLPPRRASWPDGLAEEPSRRIGALVSRRVAGMPVDDLPLVAGLPPTTCHELVGRDRDVTVIGHHLIATAAAAAIKQAALELTGDWHTRHPSLPGISLETLRKSVRGPANAVDGVLDAAIQAGELVLRDGHVARPGFAPRLAGGEELVGKVLSAIEGAGLQPPTVDELEQKLERRDLLPILKRLASEQKVVAVEGSWFFSADALNRFVTTIKEVAQNEPVTPSNLRDRLGLSRKYLIPLLEWADRSGVTRRVGDARVLV